MIIHFHVFPLLIISAYKKHDRPSLDDKVWRLRGIHKDGKLDKQLASHGIQTVKDFLRLYITNEASLREVREYTVV